MELKLPKKVEIGYMTFTVTYHKEHSGASFAFKDRSMAIGTLHLDRDPGSVFMIICHEVMEIIHCINCTRYHDESVDGNYMFVMDHKQFEVNNNMFSQAIRQFMKWK